MAANNKFVLVEEVHKVIALLESLPAQQKKEFILKSIDIAKSNIVKHKLETRFLRKLDIIKQNLLKVGMVEQSFQEFGKSEVNSIFQILWDAGTVTNKRNRRIVFFLLVATYLVLALIFFFFNLTSSSVKPLITSSIITIIAWIVVSLLYSTGYFLLNNIFEIILKPLNKYKFKFIFNEYSVLFVVTLLFSDLYFIQCSTFLESKFIVPYLYPFIIKTIKGVIELNFSSLLTSFIGIIIFILTTINSLLQIRQLIKDILEKKKDHNQGSILQEINET